jgi:hypothetical protein
MRAIRKVTLVASVAALVAGAVIVEGAGASPRAAATQHSVTVRGVEWRSLDFRAFPQYVPNTGGGVYAHVAGSTAPDRTPAFEAAMPVPAGALINQVTFYFEDCGNDSNAFGDWYFAQYNPTTGAGQRILQAKDTPQAMLDCQLHSWARPVSPAVRVLATTTYAAGADLKVIGAGDPIPNPDLVVEGARVRYTCPIGC